MSIRFFSQWLIFIFIVSLLNACGGGAFEDGSVSETLSTDTSDGFTSISASYISLQQILPSGGSTTIRFTTLIADEDRAGEIAANVPLKISVHPPGAATLENVPRSSDHNGDVSFTVSHPGSGNIVVNISGSGNVKKGFGIPLYFGASVTSEILTKNVAPADGITPIAIRVLARDWSGVGIPEISVGFAFPLNSSAVVVPFVDAEGRSIAMTDSNGEFIAGITNTVPQATKVTPFAGGMSAGALTLTFSAGLVISAPTRLNLIIKSNNVPANGTALATVIVVARDVNGTPVPHVPVHISSDSATAQLNIDEVSETLFINGNTGEEGRFELNITDTVEEEINLTATTTSGSDIETVASQTLVFANPEDVPDSGIKVARIELEVKKNSQAANTDPVYLRGRVLDETDNPIKGKIVSIIVEGGSAQIDMINDGTTDASGRFSATLTDTFAETFKAYAVSGGISSNKVDVIFTATGGGNFNGTSEAASITLLASPIQQIANGNDAINLTVLVRNSFNTPVKDVPVTIGSTSDTAIFDKGTDTTGDGGTANFTVTNTFSGSFTVTVTAPGISGIIRDSKSISFVGGVPDVTRLEIDVINNNQQANGQDPIQINVVAKDSSNRSVSDVPISVRMSAGKAAVAKESRGNTDPNGLFTTNITSTNAGDIQVTIAVEGQSAVNPKTTTITFVAIQGVETPATINLQVRNAPQPADGNSKITLLVIPRDDNNTPLSGINVKLISTDNLVFGQENGTTNELGEFRTTVTSNKPGNFDVTTVVEGVPDQNLRDTKSLTFNPVDSSNIDLQIIGDNTQLADGQATITLEVTVKDGSNNPIPNATVDFIVESDSTSALTIPSGTTNVGGKFRTTVTDTVGGKFKVTPVVNGIIGTDDVEIIFNSVSFAVDELIIDVITNNQSATGKNEDAIQINVIARGNGQPIAGVPVTVQLPTGSKAIAIPSQGVTDENGVLPVSITSTSAGDVIVTVMAEKTSIASQQQVVTFIVAGNVTPTSVDLQALNAPQPADGQSAITLVVTPRDANGAPIKDVAVELISDSTIAQIAEKNGETNALGEFRTTVTNTVAETFKITPIAGEVPGTPPTSITFFPVGIEVTDLQVMVVENNKPANGTDAAIIHVVARDSGGVAVKNVPIVVKMPTGTPAIADVSFNGNTNEREQQVTNENGFFQTQITSTAAVEVAVTIAVDGTNIAAPPKQIIFTTADSGIQPSSVDLRVENNAQPANGTSKIILIVTPRDSRGTPIPGVEVQLISDSDDVIIAETAGTTNALGEFRTSAVTTPEIAETPLTEALVVKVTPTAGSVKGTSEPVIFIPVTVPIPATLTLTALKTNASVNEEVPLIVMAKDENNNFMKSIPIRLRVEPVVGQPNVTGSIIFGQFEGQTSDTNGVFETTVKSSQTGKVNVIAEALSREGGEAILSSNAQEVVFQIPGKVIKEVSSLSLITNSSQLGSEGNSEGVIITAIVKDKNNNLVDGAEVSFTSDSGEIRLIQVENSAALPGVTDSSGRAQARLTTQGSSDNRQIIVTATVPTTTGETREDRIIIEVIGTKITIAGPTSVIQGAEETFTISLRDSEENGISGQTLSVKSELNNLLNNTASEIAVVTDVNGRAIVTMLASNAGEDTITASKFGANTGKMKVAISDSNFTVMPVPLPPQNLCSLISENEDINNNRILDEGEDVNNNGTLDLGCQVPLKLASGDGQRFNIHWDEGGNNQPNEKIILSATRGTLDKTEVFTDFNGDASFIVKPSGDAGNAIITVRAEKADGPSRQFNLKFVATDVSSVIVQASPAVIGTNPVGTDTERSEILAVVRDAENNLVFGRRVNFILEDISGGRLTQGSAITDDFGRASTVYVAGPTPSAAANDLGEGGVKVTATVVDTTVSNSVRFTVAKKSLFVTIGSGIDLTKDQETGGTRYNVFHTVLVTDANGTPVSDAELTLSIYPVTYIKAGTVAEDDGTLSFTGLTFCPNEDRNRNGLIDGDEDVNNSGVLDPGNVITVDKLNLKTGLNGFADFNVVYAIQFAGWVEAEITARAAVAGSEDSNSIKFLTVCSEEDKENCPTQNPFGSLACDQDG